MIQANELRIGNLIFRGDIVFTVSPVTLVHMFTDEKNGYISDKYQPIPITQEWLLKFGFKLFAEIATESKSPSDWYWIHSDFPFTIHNISFSIFNGNKIIKIKSVHQLQNLYFALTGKELEIK